MSLFWSRHGDCWEPEGGEHRDWRDLRPGDLLQNGRKIWRVHEVNPVPPVDWDDADREGYARWGHQTGLAEDEWPWRPLYVVVSPERGGEKRHVKVRPYNGLRSGAYVLSPHYPVCADCGEPWPCPEIGIGREARRQSAELDRLSGIMPGCCWSCGDPVTGRQSSIVFDGENLLLPGAPPPVFHLRSKGGCRAAAMQYEDRWVLAGDGRSWRLQCTGKLTTHVGDRECDSPACPGIGAYHSEHVTHVLKKGGSVLRWVRDCSRCEDVAEQDGLRWLTGEEIRAMFSGRFR